MTATLTLSRKSTPGVIARRLRLSNHLSQQELADLVGVPFEQVGFFEQGLPVPLGPEITVEEGMGSPDGRSESNQPMPVTKLALFALGSASWTPAELPPPLFESYGFIFLLLSVIHAWAADLNRGGARYRGFHAEACFLANARRKNFLPS